MGLVGGVRIGMGVGSGGWWDQEWVVGGVRSG